MKKKIFYLFAAAIFLSLLCLLPTCIYAQGNTRELKRLVVFYSPGCKRCMEIKNTVLPEIKEQFKDSIEIEYRNLDDIQNYKLLLGLEKARGVKINNTPPVFYFAGTFLEGAVPAVKERLIKLILESPAAPVLNMHSDPPVDLTQRFKGFEPLAVAGAGLVDGINPCAFTVIIFFISFLALQGYRKRELIIIGASFILAVFLTYSLIGLGLFGFLYSLKGFWLLAKIFNLGIGIFSITLGIFAVYDFLKFKKSGQTEGLLLQLPKAIKNRIHAVIGLYYRKDRRDQEESRLNKPISRLVASAFITGFLVSILEAVCTGQVYLPTITFVLKATPLKLQALAYLLLYNLMFIIPLFVIFVLALFGTTSEQFSRFLKKHLLTLKLLMAILFFSLGIFLIWKG